MAWRILKRLVWVSKLLLPAVSITISRTFRCDVYDEGELTEISVMAVDHSVDCMTNSCESGHFTPWPGLSQLWGRCDGGDVGTVP